MTDKRKTDDPALSGKGAAAAAARRRRKAALLRENLLKRKAQRRERGPEGGKARRDGQESEK